MSNKENQESTSNQKSAISPIERTAEAMRETRKAGGFNGREVKFGSWPKTDKPTISGHPHFLD